MTPARSLLLLSLAAALALPAPGVAAPLAFQGSLSIEFPDLATCLDDPPPGQGACGWPLEFRAEAAGVAEIGSGGKIALAGGFATAGTRYISDNYGPTLYPIVSIAVSAANGPGQLGAACWTMPLFGVAKLCLFGQCQMSPAANISVPLSVVGVGGVATNTELVNADRAGPQARPSAARTAVSTRGASERTR